MHYYETAMSGAPRRVNLPGSVGKAGHRHFRTLVDAPVPASVTAG